MLIAVTSCEWVVGIYLPHDCLSLTTVPPWSPTRQPEQEAALDDLCGYMRRQLARLRLEKYRPSDQDRPPLLYTFHTLHGLTVDLRLFNR